MLEHSSTDRAAARRTIENLTTRELEVLDLASGGLTNAEVGARLALTVHAVKFHLASVFRKLDVANRTEAAAVYLSESVGKRSGRQEGGS